jgi:tRNA (guanine37-N1)-methyltransferase
MRIEVLTIFPGLFSGVLDYGLIHQAKKKGILDLCIRDLRDYTSDRHRTVDDEPYGGGPGMVFKPEPIFEALDQLKRPGALVVLPDPQGEIFRQEIAEELARYKMLIFVCGRYEGVDERVRKVVDREISVGDFVTMGGELPSLLMIESIVRFLPGVVGQQDSVELDSFQKSLLDYPHYTRPVEYRDNKVPEILLSGNHEQIRIWRRKMALKRTLEKRPDLLQKAVLTDEDKELIQELKKENIKNQDSYK